MVHGRCVVQGCNRKSTNDKDNPVRIFSIPVVRKYDADITFRRRVLWLKRLNLSDEKIPSGGVCDVHFIAGKPSHYIEETNPDWAPTQKIGSKNLVAKSALDRYNRRKKFQSVKTYRIESLTKRNIKRVADLHPSTASSSREIASIDKKDLPSVEVAVKKITQPGVLKKPEETVKVVNKNQLDIFWMHQLPVKNSSQVCNGKVTKLGETNNPNATQSLNMKGFVNRTEYKKGGVGTKNGGEGLRRPMVILPVSTLQQVMRDPCGESSLFVSDSMINDHDYCAKPTIEKGQHHVYLDHDYCQSFQSNEPSSPIPENISESSPMLRQTETPMHNQLELTSNEIRENPYEVAIQQDGSHSTCEINTICDFILPNSEQCSTCDELASLKSDLEQKSLVLETRRKDVNSLKQELALAKEQISNLRAQLEENTRTLWSCLSMNGKSS